MSELIIEKDPKSPISESYRTIRINIDFSSIDKEIKSVLITSSGPKEGKTTTSSNIALAYAQAGKKTLLIDCDLRKPNIHKLFKISNAVGFTNMMAEGLKLSDIVNSYNDNLKILTSGTIPPNPSEILSSNKMKVFLEEASKVFDRIIIDSPPINVVADAQILSAIADGVLLVVTSEGTDIESAKMAKDMLLKAKANILGVVLRRLKVSRGNYGYNRYNYYSEDGDTKRRKKKIKKRKFKNN